MAKHEFGIIQIAPQKGKRYDEYEPQKYDCISVNDDYIEKIVSDFDDIDFYWHSIDIPGKGLSYCGISQIQLPQAKVQPLSSFLSNFHISIAASYPYRVQSLQRWSSSSYKRS